MLAFIFDKVTDLKAGSYIKKRLHHRCFPVNIATFLGTAFIMELFQWLLLEETSSMHKAETVSMKYYGTIIL